MGPQVLSFVERFIILCPYLGESTIRGSTRYCITSQDIRNLFQILEYSTLGTGEMQHPGYRGDAAPWVQGRCSTLGTGAIQHPGYRGNTAPWVQGQYSTLGTGAIQHPGYRGNTAPWVQGQYSTLGTGAIQHPGYRGNTAPWVQGQYSSLGTGEILRELKGMHLTGGPRHTEW